MGSGCRNHGRKQLTVNQGQDGPKTAPRRPQDGPKTAPTGPQEGRKRARETTFGVWTRPCIPVYLYTVYLYTCKRVHVYTCIPEYLYTCTKVAKLLPACEFSPCDCLVYRYTGMPAWCTGIQVLYPC